ncbi:MAG: D-glycero-beta-D-manno-heptose-7-phosphate kinase [Bacteroidetes bacterium]|nr:D-glycero-beta-D-manno-heptose-7-phosphate kinase [Bacteroidota bacterium]
MAIKSIQTIFEGFRNIKALIVGDVMLDAYIWGIVDRISPEAPVPVIKTTGKEYRLGGAANVALNLKALGATPVLCAIIGADYEGDKFLERLKVRKISNSGIVRSKPRPTTIKTRILSGYQHIVRMDSETDMLLSANEEKALLDKVFENMTDADVVIFEDYDKGTLTKSLILKIISRATELKVPTVVDPKIRNFHNYNGSTVFKPNLQELVEGLNLIEYPETIGEIMGAVNQLKDVVDVGEIFLTLSEKGVIVKNNKEEIHIPAHVRTISDVSGAGDTMTSIISLCKALGLSLAFTAELANIGGGLVCEHVGVVPINKNKLMEDAIKYELEKML